MQKKIIIPLAIFIGVIAVTSLLHVNIIKLPLERAMHARYIDGLADDRVFVGAMHNIFVAKVVRTVGQTVSENAPITTQFEVEIVTNIKGELSGKMIISQEGGYQNGIFYSMEGQKLMQAGSTYIMSARTDGQGTYLVSSYPRGLILLSKNAELTVVQLSDLSAASADVLALKIAYTQEIPYQVDVDNAFNLNSYSSLKK